MTGLREPRSIGAASVLALLVAASLAGAAEPTPDEVWFQFRDAYAGLAGYHDTGEIELVDQRGTRRYRFRTDLESDGEVRFSFQPDGGAPDSLTSKGPESAPTLAAGLAGALGEGAPEALPVPGLLAAGALSLPEPEALALDGVEPCGSERCRVLVGTIPDGGSFRLWLGESDHLLRRSEVEVVRGGERRRYLVRLAPVVEARLQEQERVFSETVTVDLSSIDVRVIDERGKAVTGLVAADFRLRLGREELPIQAVEWVGETTPEPEALASVESAAPALDDVPDDWEESAPPPARLVLFFVQANLDPQRTTTEMKVRGAVRSFVDGLPLTDRAAVVSFDSHLKLRLDFTAEREAIHEALDAAWRTGPAPRLDRQGSRRRRPRDTDPSLAESLDRAAAERAASPEGALALAARAMVPLPGEKLVVFLGWGLGERSMSGVIMPPEYADALRALEAAKASVFVLDVSDTAFHSLEVGLQQVAEDTGGTYAKTNEFPALAARRLEEAISGHYLIFFQLPEGDRKRARELRVDLRDPGRGEVLVRATQIR